MNKILKYFTIALLGAGAASCDDFFDLKPQNEMVLEEFWQNESDALSVVGSCYRSMQEPGFMQRLLVWGEFRSDNCILGSGDGGDLNNIANLNLLPSNGYASWSDFYAVINLCNTVEHFAPIAYERDPNFTLGQLNGYLAEVKTIRAYCYFTLVRAFRDIPFTTEPTIDDTVPMRLPQSDPDEIINFLIDDLKAAEPGAITRWSQVSYTKGRITQNAVRCLIADMCLWQGRYAEAEEYCNRILMDGNSELELVSPNNYNKGVFIDGNSTESIFELQFNRGIIPNYAVCEFYGTAGAAARRSRWWHTISPLPSFGTIPTSASMTSISPMWRAVRSPSRNSCHTAARMTYPPRYASRTTTTWATTQATPTGYYTVWPTCT